MTGVPAELMVKEFISVRPGLIKFLGGANEAILWSHIKFRSNPNMKHVTVDDDGVWWTPETDDDNDPRGLDLLAEETGLSQPQAQRAMKKLIEVGAIVARANGHDRIRSYRVVIDEAPESVNMRNRILEDTKSHVATHAIASSQDAESHVAPPIKNLKKTKTGIEFEEFWKLYPNQVAKGDARDAWHKARLAGTPASEILVAVKAYAENPGVTDPKFIPTPARWLAGERWLDKPATVTKKTTSVLDRLGSNNRREA